MLECRSKTARILLMGLQLLLPVCDSQGIMLMDAAAASVAAHLSMSLLRYVRAAMQHCDAVSGSPPIGLCTVRLFASVCAATELQQELLLSVRTSRPEFEQRGEELLLCPHMLHVNMAIMAMNAVLLQEGSSSPKDSSRAAPAGSSTGRRGSKSGGGSGDGSSGESSSSSSGSSSNSREPAELMEVVKHLEMRNATTVREEKVYAYAADTWQRACQMAASLTPCQLKLFDLLEVDARVLLWVQPQTLPTVDILHTSLVCIATHRELLMAWGMDEERLDWKQPQQQWLHEQQLFLLLPCAVVPCYLSLLGGGIAWDTAPSDVCGLVQLMLPCSKDFGADLGAAAARAGLQCFPLREWLEDLLRNLLQQSARLAREQQEQQQEKQQHVAGKLRASADVLSASSSGGGSSGGSRSSESGGGIRSSKSGGSSSGSKSGGSRSSGSTRPVSSSSAGSLPGLDAVRCVYIGKALGTVMDIALAGWSALVPSWLPALAASVGIGRDDLPTSSSPGPPPLAALLHRRFAAILAHVDCCVRAVAAVIQGPEGCIAKVLDETPAELYEAMSQVYPNIFLLEAKCKWACAAGPGREQRQLHSLSASLLKLHAGTGTGDMELTYSSYCRQVTCETVMSLGMGPGMQHTAGSALQLLPGLVLFGRLCLQWAQDLQLAAAAMPHPPLLRTLIGPVGGPKAGQPPGLLVATAGRLQAWLRQPEVAAELSAAGYHLEELLQQLQQLEAVSTAEASAAAADNRQRAAEQTSQPSLVQQLRAVGTALSSVAVPLFCNNSSCSNVSGPTELRLVFGRSCMCSGCRTARY